MKNVYFAVIKFPVFVSLSLIILVGLFFGVAISSYSRTGLSLHEAVIYTLVFIGLVFMVSNWILILMSTHTVIKPAWMQRHAQWMLSKVYYPMALFLNSLFLRKKPGLQESFLNFNNEIIMCNYRNLKDPSILVLLPHCLQNAECKIRITKDINACEGCGNCDIADAKATLGKYPVTTAVATGGSLARKLIQDNNPNLIIAVACHRDLIDGVRDSWKLPVFSVLNDRPNGPCFDTTVNISAIEFAIKRFL
ncbi:MAG TPA: DUF116 domain-containing protein [Candidatus Cloacimonadota bacterium]|nr:DUF116 domain-containing protein [Candidatus Cloacimonadota bacterium]HPS38225.1 DUF116 domain-containing protein [Candidatus Cloacimonadota bacterium]